MFFVSSRFACMNSYYNIFLSESVGIDIWLTLDASLDKILLYTFLPLLAAFGYTNPDVRCKQVYVYMRVLVYVWMCVCMWVRERKPERACVCGFIALQNSCLYPYGNISLFIPIYPVRKCANVLAIMTDSELTLVTPSTMTMWELLLFYFFPSFFFFPLKP